MICPGCGKDSVAITQISDRKNDDMGRTATAASITTTLYSCNNKQCTQGFFCGPNALVFVETGDAMQLLRSDVKELKLR